MQDVLRPEESVLVFEASWKVRFGVISFQLLTVLLAVEAIVSSPESPKSAALTHFQPPPMLAVKPVRNMPPLLQRGHAGCTVHSPGMQAEHHASTLRREIWALNIFKSSLMILMCSQA